jgi:hypothetical protein
MVSGVGIQDLRFTSRKVRSTFREIRARQARTQADDGDRTRDPQLGKLMLYQLSYVRAALRIARKAR